MSESEDNEELTSYVINYYPHLLTKVEAQALNSIIAEAKAKVYGGQMAEHIRQNYVSTAPEVLRLLANGVHTFRQRVRDRILSEHKNEVYLNRCPKCHALTRTPSACLCPKCNHTWYETRDH